MKTIESSWRLVALLSAVTPVACISGQTGDPGLGDEAVESGNGHENDDESDEAVESSSSAEDDATSTEEGTSASSDDTFVDVSDAELTACNPLAPWRRTIDAANPEVVGEDAAGVVYAVVLVDGEFVVLRSSGEQLIPLQVSGSGAGEEVTVTVRDGAGAFTFAYAPAEAPTSFTLFPDSDAEREPDPASGEELTLREPSALAALELQPIVVQPRVEVHAGSDPQAEVLVLSPEWAWGYEDFRLFYGSNGVLAELPITSLQRTREGSSALVFNLPDGTEATLNFETSESGAGLFIGEDGEHLAKRTATELGLSRLTLQCLEPVARRFELSNDPPSPELPMECGSRLPMGACIASSALPTPDPSGAPLQTNLAGVLLGMGEGSPPADATLPSGVPQGCPGGGVENTIVFGDLYNSVGNVATDLHWLHIGNETAESWIVLRGFSASLPLTVGAEVTLRQSSTYDFGGATDSFIELRDAEGELLFWLGQSYNLESLDMPSELTLTRGVERCSLSDTCATDFGIFSLEAALGDGNTQLDQGQPVELADWTLLNSVYQVGTGEFVCTDSSADFIRVALWRTP